MRRMPKTQPALLAICVLGAGLLARAPAALAVRPRQGPTCIPLAEEDSIGVYLLSRVATFSVRPDSAFNQDRILYQLPLVRTDQIALVTNEKICSRAAAAYAAALAGQGSGLTGRVLVAQVGAGATGRYVVLDPYFAPDPTHRSYVHLVMDFQFRVLHRFP